MTHVRNSVSVRVPNSNLYILPPGSAVSLACVLVLRFIILNTARLKTYLRRLEDMLFTRR